jgi:O-antigen/teichoic acid export membrane protein
MILYLKSIHNMSSGTIMAIANALVILISYPIYLGFVGYEAFGVWSIMLAIISMSAVLGLNIDRSIIKFVAQCKTNNEVKKYITGSILISILASLIFWLFLYNLHDFVIEIYAMDRKYSSVVKDILSNIALLTMSVYVVNILKGALTGLSEIAKANYLFIIGEVIKALTAMSLLWLEFGLQSFVYGWIAGNLTLIVIYAYCLKKINGRILLFNFNLFKILKEIITYGRPLVFNNLIGLLFVPIITFIIARYVGLSEVAYYNIASRISSNINVLFSRGVIGLMPEISKAGLIRDRLSRIFKIKELHSQAIKYVLYFGVPLIVLIFGLSESILLIWLSEMYNENINETLQLLLIATLLDILIIPTLNILFGLGETKKILHYGLIKVTTLFIGLGYIKFNELVIGLNNIAILIIIASFMSASYFIFTYYKLTKTSNAL